MDEREREALGRWRKENPASADLLEKLSAEGKVSVVTESNSAAAEGADNMLVCAGWWPGTIPGSMRGSCSKCQSYVSLAPSTVRMLGRRTAPAYVLCPKCAESKVRAIDLDMRSEPQ